MGLLKIILPAYSFPSGPDRATADFCCPEWLVMGMSYITTEPHLHQTPDSRACFYKWFNEFCFKLPLNHLPRTCLQLGHTYSTACAHLPNRYSEPSDTRVWYPTTTPLRSPPHSFLGAHWLERPVSSRSGSLPSIPSPTQTWDLGSGFLSVLP